MQVFKSKIFWVFYIICAVLFFFYILFPSDAVKEYLADQIHQVHPGLAVEIGRVKPGFPPGLRLYDVNIYHLDRTLAEVEDLKISADILSLFSATTQLSFWGNSYGGSFKGRVDIIKDSTNKEMVVNADLAGIQMKQMEALSALTIHKISGNLDGTLTFKTKAPLQELNGDLLLTNGEIEFSPPILNQKILSFNTIEAELEVNNRSLTIHSCQIEGNQLAADITGSIKFGGRSTRKILNLSGVANPHPALLAKLGKNLPQLLAGRNSDKQGFPFKITGTMDSPEYSFN